MVKNLNKIKAVLIRKLLAVEKRLLNPMSGGGDKNVSI
jgi:hypothetical protein